MGNIHSQRLTLKTVISLLSYSQRWEPFCCWMCYQQDRARLTEEESFFAWVPRPKRFSSGLVNLYVIYHRDIKSVWIPACCLYHVQFWLLFIIYQHIVMYLYDAYVCVKMDCILTYSTIWTLYLETGRYLPYIFYISWECFFIVLLNDVYNICP